MGIVNEVSGKHDFPEKMVEYKIELPKSDAKVLEAIVLIYSNKYSDVKDFITKRMMEDIDLARERLGEGRF